MIKLGLQGILLSKVSHQERHLIGQLLTRQGRRVSVLFYGGQGGGKKLKSSGLEVGHLIDVQCTLTRTSSELAHGREWTVPWQHEHIRHQHQAFSLMCFMLEIIRTLAPEDHLADQHREIDTSHEGLFRVLSNGLARLDQRLANKSFRLYEEWVLFLGKLLIEQGVFPERQHCVLSGELIRPGQRLCLMMAEGGFARIELLKSRQEQEMMGEVGTELWQVLFDIARFRYDQEIESLAKVERSHIQALTQYLFYQVQLEPHKIKSLALLS